MLINEIAEWIKVGYQPLQFSIPDQTIEQNIRNAYRYFNNNSAIQYTEMVPKSGVRIPISKHIKAVSSVIPASLPGVLNIQDFPLWSLLGIQVIDNLNTDLMMLTDTYKNYSIYMGKDFQWTFQPQDAPLRVTNEAMQANATDSSGLVWVNTLLNVDIVPGTLVISSTNETFTDDGVGNLISDASNGTAGAVDYQTGVVDLTWVNVETTATATYQHVIGGYIYVDNVPVGTTNLCVIGALKIFEDEDIINSTVLDFLLRYSKALCMVAEGNVLRKSSIINITSDGNDYITEYKEEIKALQQELNINGRWMTFGRRI